MREEVVRIDFDEIRESDIRSFITLLEERSQGVSLMAESDFTPEMNRIEPSILAGVWSGDYEEPVKYSFEDGEVYTMIEDEEFLVVGEASNMEAYVPEAYQLTL